jgi:hypothetical protein
VAGPQLRLEPYESKDELCNTIDIPADLFVQVAPTIEDMKYLAHVREVKTDAKETLSYLADGWFSVVMGNRMPQPKVSLDAGDPSWNPPPGSDQSAERELAVENRVFLVSLEGMEGYLGRPSLLADRAVRMVVLATWNFHCSATGTFKDSMVNMKTGPLHLDTKDVTDADVVSAYKMGYVALNHNTRLGEKTVSWYRGPLSPVPRKMRNYKFRPAPDALLRYDYRTAMMEVTYSAAFQLGRLLALQDRPFSRALTRWRERLRLQMRADFRRQDLRDAVKANPDTASDPLQIALAEAITGADFRAGRADDPNRAESYMDTAGTDLTTPPETVRQWLARLILLYRVPFNYLVPDQRLLPADSMRFFSLDPGWLKCLLEGACSVGRNSAGEEAVDEILRNKFLSFENAIENATKVRSDTVVPQSTNCEMEGFLMRSPVVQGWQGLEMRAWSSYSGKITEGSFASLDDGLVKPGNPVQPLRIDRLAPDVMLCIFNGPVALIEVRQPPEGMHFGVAVNKKGGYQKTTLRRITDGSQVENSTIKVETRVNSPRVVDINSVATQMIHMKDKLGVQGDFTSAEMAVEMTESPGQILIFKGESL